MLPDMRPGDVIRLKKPHPCGSTDWVVLRIGADIRIKCLGCSRRILLTRRDLAKRMKGYVSHNGCEDESGTVSAEKKPG